MSNPLPPYSKNIQTFIPGVKQTVSDSKWTTKTLALGAAPVATDFFTSAPSQDVTIDNYDAGNQLVTSFKVFVIQSLQISLKGAATAAGLVDINALIEQGVLVLTAQNKEVGRFRLRRLNAGGGLFVAGAQAAAASNVGVTNGLPSNDVFEIAPLEMYPNQSFKATLQLSNTAANVITLSAPVDVQLVLGGYEVRPGA